MSSYNKAIAMSISKENYDLCRALQSDRKNLAEKLITTYDYNNLLDLVQAVETNVDPDLINTPDKNWYKLMADTKSNQALYWLPTKQLVQGILKIADDLHITTIEETFAGSGLLSSLLQMSSPDLKVTASDSFDNPETTGQLSVFPVAKRIPSDFKYYKALGVAVPQMIICTFYPSTSTTNTQFVSEINYLISSAEHMVIMLILPVMYHHLHDYLYRVNYSGKYNVLTNHIKVVDRYAALTFSVKDFCPSNMMACTLIKKDLDLGLTLSPTSLSEMIIDQPINQTKSDMYWLMLFYNWFGSKLYKSITRTVKFDQINMFDSKIERVQDSIGFFKRLRLIEVPVYIYDIDEYLYWVDLLENRNYFIFHNRLQFFAFYSKMKLPVIELCGYVPDFIRNAIVTHSDILTKYIYIQNVIGKHNKKAFWNQNYQAFMRKFDKVNSDNRKLMLRA